MTCATCCGLLARYRLLLIAMGTARGTTGGLALADLAERGYVLDGTALMPTARPIDRVSVIRGGGLPRRPSRSRTAKEIRIATFDLGAYPMRSLVSSHETNVRRRAKRGLGPPPDRSALHHAGTCDWPIWAPRKNRPANDGNPP